MKLLVLNDLHGNENWFNWVLNETNEYQDIVIAGDLCNGHAPFYEAELGKTYDFFIELQKIKRNILFCSGNHDKNYPDGISYFIRSQSKISDKILQLERWMTCLHSENCFGDHSNVIINNVLFTCFENNEFSIPEVYQENINTLNDALILKGDKKWIVLHHSPPIGTLLCKSFPFGGDDWIKTTIKQHNPNIVLCGHVHGSPFVNGGIVMEKINETFCFNGGCTLKNKNNLTKIPTHIILDIDNNIYNWYDGLKYKGETTLT